jgi:hypothetical protein
MALVTAILIASPFSCAIAQTQPAAISLGSEVRAFADISAGQKPPPGHDHLLAFGRDANGEMVVTGIAILPAKDAKFAAEKGTIALLRIRGKYKTKLKRPDPEEIRFASSYAIPVFISREWGKPPAFWELAAVNGIRSYRSIGGSNSASAWTTLPQ